VKTLAAQGSDGSFSRVREDDILTAALETPEHRGRVRGVFSSLAGVKGLVKSSLEYTGRRGTRGLILMILYIYIVRWNIQEEEEQEV
jgi:hypothetical protein